MRFIPSTIQIPIRPHTSPHPDIPANHSNLSYVSAQNQPLSFFNQQDTLVNHPHSPNPRTPSRIPLPPSPLNTRHPTPANIPLPTSRGSSMRNTPIPIPTPPWNERDARAPINYDVNHNGDPNEAPIQQPAPTTWNALVNQHPSQHIQQYGQHQINQVPAMQQQQYTYDPNQQFHQNEHPSYHPSQQFYQNEETGYQAQNPNYLGGIPHNAAAPVNPTFNAAPIIQNFAQPAQNPVPIQNYGDLNEETAEHIAALNDRIRYLESQRAASAAAHASRNDQQAVAFARMMERLEILESRNLSDRLQRRRSTSPVDDPPRTRGLRCVEAEEYDGSAAELESWLNQLSLMWVSDPSKWKDHDVRIRYAFSRMRKLSAKSWVDTVMPDFLQGVVTWASWDDFVDTLRGAFPSENRKFKALNAIRTIRMDGRKPVQDFFIEWESHARHTGINHDGLLLFLLDAITTGLRAGIGARFDLASLDTYQKFKEAAISVDQNYRTTQQVNARLNPLGFRSRADVASSWRNPADRLKGRSPAASPDTGKKQQTNANTSSNTGATAELPAEADKLKRGCYNCGSTAHKIKDCPLPPKKAHHTVRNILLDMSDEEVHQLSEDMQDDAYLDRECTHFYNDSEETV
ncbi:hypothetical protein D9611_002160 [Ephemerocybe angulata]|uniref:CCHC-type domain-containing protein n=1 Tax=Ephemerocybe angulata TaxID=980116 RepID=A0A8H5FLX1_9AGAR|nr:hypothetical protein D9611_002160 [Tulosesus angulatus]